MPSSLFDPGARAKLLERIDRLRPDSPRRWGKMTAGQVQVHLADQLRIALGQMECRPKASPLGWPPLRWIVIHSPIPWPKGAPTAPELRNPAAKGWDADRAALIAIIEETAARGEDFAWTPHPVFGRLDGHSWGVLMWRHIDHHLRQFGG